MITSMDATIFAKEGVSNVETLFYAIVILVQ